MQDYLLDYIIRIKIQSWLAFFLQRIKSFQVIYCRIKPLSRLIGLVVRVFAKGAGDLGSIPGSVIPKTLKMVLDTSLLSTQQYKVRIKGKVEQFRERNSALPYTPV